MLYPRNFCTSARIGKCCMAALYLDRSAAFDVGRAQDFVAKLLLRIQVSTCRYSDSSWNRSRIYALSLDPALLHAAPFPARLSLNLLRGGNGLRSEVLFEHGVPAKNKCHYSGTAIVLSISSERVITFGVSVTCVLHCGNLLHHGSLPCWRSHETNTPWLVRHYEIH